MAFSTLNSTVFKLMHSINRAAASGGGGEIMPTTDAFDRTVYHISTRGEDYGHHSTMSPPEFDRFSS